MLIDHLLCFRIEDLIFLQEFDDKVNDDDSENPLEEAADKENVDQPADETNLEDLDTSEIKGNDGKIDFFLSMFI